MIKLTLQTGLEPKVLTFYKTEIVIGSAQTADLSLPEEPLEAIHLKIMEQDGCFIAINCANDPFVTINNCPFRKKTLKQHDAIQIGHTIVQFEGEPAIVPKPLQQPFNDDVDALFREVENLNISVSMPLEPSIKEEEPPQPESRPVSPLFKSRRFLSMLCLTIVLSISLSALMFYVKVRNQSQKETIVAAESIADVAIALAYAQINHIKPKGQAWIDAEFLKNNLAPVLSPGYPSFANIDTQGQFLNCPYILRIYANNDLSQFLVLAQPEPSMLQWLVPKATIAIDSKNMELHSIEDLKDLNRLLVNVNMFDDTNANDIFHLVQQSEVISLASLGTKKGFAPPSALAFVHPGAENYVYNAPRYYHFGETLLKKAIALYKTDPESPDIARLQEEVTALARYPYFVLYSSQGIEKALQAHQALAYIVPDRPFLAGYLTFNSNGLIANSQLLFEGDDTSKMTIASAEQAEIDHPIVRQLKTLSKERKKALQEISDPMIDLLNQRNQNHEVVFSDPFSKLVLKYRKTDREHCERLTQCLKQLPEEYPSLTAAELDQYIRAAGLNPALNNLPLSH